MESIVGKNSRHYWMGIAMIWIVLFHWMNPICENEAISQTIRLTLSRIFGSGFIGVDIFLFLSAYGLCHSFTKNSYRVYLARRLKRLFPVFLIFIVFYLYFIANIRDWHSLVKLTLLHISGLSSFSSQSYAWYIPATIFIYWSFPIWFYTVKWLELKSSILLWVFFMSILVLKPITMPYIFWLLSGRFVMVILGILTYIWLQDSQTGRNRNLIFLFAIPAILAMFFGQSKAEIIGVSLPLIFYAIDRSGIKHYGNKFISFIGKHTLEIYLAQCIAIESLTPPILELWLSQIHIPGLLLWPIAMIIELLLTVALSFVLYFIQTGPQYIQGYIHKSIIHD